MLRKKHDVIDGQQRLTSLILILSELKDHCSSQYEDRHKQLLLFPKKNKEFVLQEPTYLTKEIKKSLGYDSNFNTQGYRANISETMDRIKSQIVNGWNGKTNEWYESLYEYILNKVNFISLEYTKISDSLKYFLNINSLSIPLTQVDIFYSIFSQSLRISKDTHNIFEIKEKIKRLSGIKGLNSQLENYSYEKQHEHQIENIIYVFLNSYYQGYKKLTDLNETGIGSWLSLYKNGVFNDQIEAKKFVDNFIQYLDDFEYISNYFTNKDDILGVDTSSRTSWILLNYGGFKCLLKMLVELFKERHNYIDEKNNLCIEGKKEIDNTKLEEISKRLNLTLIWNNIRGLNLSQLLDGFPTNISLDNNGQYRKTIDNIKSNIILEKMFDLNYNDHKGSSNEKIKDESKSIKTIFACQEAYLNHTAKPRTSFNTYLESLLNSDIFSLEHLLSVKEWQDVGRREKWKLIKGKFNTNSEFDVERYNFINLSLLDKSNNASASDDEIHSKLTKYSNARSVCNTENEYLIQSLVGDSEYYKNESIQALNLPERQITNIEQNTWEHSKNNREFNEKLMQLVVDYISKQK